ncbi:MBL fold hydrolase [Morganella morganii]|uniref:MBL fold hydrolase n=1 Tax=Morganella morganii TaxID=582 RepID=A0A433ZZC2_MORMO|nr:MBL fold hydrolase [Morganella morganii]
MKNMILGLLLTSSMLSSGGILAANMEVKVYNPQQASLFPVSSTLLTGKNEAILIDAQFQKNDAEKLVSLIKASNRKLTTIFISYNDPDYYFGLDTILNSFPDAKVISTAQTAYLISESKDEKLHVWKAALKSNAPDKLVTPTAIIGDKLTLEGQDIFIKRNPRDPSHIFLWIPSIKTIVAGVSVFDGTHVWTADTQGREGYNNWKAILDEMKKLSPEKVIPSHYIDKQTDYSPKSIDFTRQYISDFEKTTQSAKSSVELIAAMQSKYKNLSGVSNLEMSAKVAMNEMPWSVKQVFPAIGKTLEVKFGETVFDLTFHDNQIMSFIGTSGAFKGVKDKVSYRAVEVAERVYMVYWHEPSTGSNVVHIENFNNNKVYTNIAAKDGSFTHLVGSFTIKSK